MRKIAFLFCFSFLFACNDEAKPSTAQVTEALPWEDAIDSCVQFRQRAYECRHDLVDGLVSARASSLSDIAAAITSKRGRTEIREVALAELEADGTGPYHLRRASCVAAINERPPTMARVSALEECFVNDGCEAWTRCVLPHIARPPVNPRVSKASSPR